MSPVGETYVDEDEAICGKRIDFRAAGVKRIMWYKSDIVQVLIDSPMILSNEVKWSRVALISRTLIARIVYQGAFYYT